MSHLLTKRTKSTYVVASDMQELVPMRLQGSLFDNRISYLQGGTDRYMQEKK